MGVRWRPPPSVAIVTHFVTQAFPAVLFDLQPEELGIDRQPQRLLVMEWAPKHPAKMTPPEKRPWSEVS